MRVAINYGQRTSAAGKLKDAEAFYDEGRQLTIRSIEADPSDPVTFTYLNYSIGGLSEVYAKSDRVAKGIEFMTHVVGNLSARANANPAVLAYQNSLSYAHDDLRKLYQRTGDYEKAVASLQEIIRISDALTSATRKTPNTS